MAFMIAQVSEKIKGYYRSFGTEIFVVLFCLLLALTLGGAYVAYRENPPHSLIRVQQNAFIMNESSQKAFMASKAGEAYYPIACKAGNTIKESNKIYFSTEIDAQKAGFERSSRCK